MKHYNPAVVLMIVAALFLAACSRGEHPKQTASNGQPGQVSAPPASAPAPSQPTPPPPAAAPNAQTADRQAPPGSAPAVPPAGASGQAPPAPMAAEKPAPPVQTQVREAPPPPPPPPPPPKPKTFELSQGSHINVVTNSAMSTKTLQSGQTFTASLAAPIVVNGVVIASKGSDVVGRVVDSDPGGRVSGVATLTLGLASFRTRDGQAIRVQTSPFKQSAKSTKKKDAAKIGIGAGVGTAIGAIAGGGKGAGIGALVGGGAGTAATLATRGDPAVVPAESVLDFVVSQPVEITEVKPGSLAPISHRQRPPEP